MRVSIRDATALPALARAIGDVKTRYDAAPDGDVGHAVPDVRRAVAAVRSCVLAGCVVMFSAVIPIGDRAEASRYWLMAEAFGARCVHRMEDGVTHVVAVRDGTAKVAAARARGGIAVVQLSWLVQSCARYMRVDEALCPLVQAQAQAQQRIQQ